MNPRKPIPGLGALLALSCTALNAQVTSTTPGEIAVYSNSGAGIAAPIAPGTPVDNTFLFDELNLIAFGAPTADLLLSQGKYLVLYNCRVNSVSGSNRAELRAHLSLEPAGGGIPVDLSYGWSHELLRVSSGANQLVLSGGTIVDAASTNDILRLQTTRTDVNSGRITNIPGGETAIQFLKLDDSWDYLRLSKDIDDQAASDPTFQDVLYDVVDEASAGAMSFTVGTGDIVFNAAGRYLVMANTALSKPAGNNTRTGYTQQLTLDGTPIEGSKTTTYLRGNPNSEQANNGVAAIGILIEATAGQVLNVEQMRESGITCSINSLGTGLAIVQLPAFGQYISLSDASGQSINNATATPMNFADQHGAPGADFTHAFGTSAVTVNTAGSYLFLGAFFCDDDTADRQVPHQRWSITGAPLFYGQGSRYSRNTGIQNNGNWSGFVANLSAADTVEMTTAALATNTASMPGDSLGLQGLRIGSLFPSDDPSIAVNNSLNLVGSESGTITSALLATSDANTGPAALIYTVTSLPAEGTLLLNGVARTTTAPNNTFTQDDVDQGLLTFDAGPTVQSNLIGLTVADDDGGATDSANFAVEIGLVTIVAPDSGTTNEDTILIVLDPGAATSVLANDVGTGLTVTGITPLSSQGAAVTANGDGTFRYDPRSSAALQMLAVGEQVVDIFSYTVTDFSSNSTVVDVSITVNGVNDTPSATGESFTSLDGAGAASGLLDNESDTDASDVLSVSNLTQQVFGNGGAVPTETFNFESFPLVFTSQFGATVSVSGDGTFSYDVSTSATLLGLEPGVSISETFNYDVFDGNATVSTSIEITSLGADQPTNDYAITDAGTTVNLGVLSNDRVRNNPGALGLPTSGAVLEFLADGIGNSSTQWFNTGSATLASIPDGGAIDATLNLAVTNPPPGMLAAYTFAGTEGIVHDGNDVVSYGDSDNLDSTLEFLFRPSDQVGAEVVWEVGGATDGSSLVIVGDKVMWTSGDNGNLIAQAVAQLPPGAIAGGDFVHVVCKIDLTNDVAEIFINGQFAGSGAGVNVNNGAAGNLADWCGTDPGGIGRSQTAVGGDVGNLGAFGTTDFGAPTDFAGEVSLLRTYNSLLTSAQIVANFDAIFGSSNPAVAADITDLAGSGVPSVGVAVPLPSGARVTLEADGTFTYDPNGAFPDLGVGLIARDSFTYGLDTASNSTVTVNVDVTGTNTDPQITIAAVNRSTLEGVGTTFTISASAAVTGSVDVTLSFSGLADHGGDFTGLGTVQIPNVGNSVVLSNFVLNDSLFEGLENIVVTIDSVSGNAVLGGTLSAETLVNDVQTAPDFSIAADQGSAQEGTAAGFTITGTVPSQADRILTVGYSGTALNGADYFGTSTVVVPGGSNAGDLDISLFDDALVEGTEELTITLEGVDTGTIGTDDSASTNITDGTGECLFLADFENIDPFGIPGTPGGSVLGTDAPAAANLGTPIGSWFGVPTEALAGDLPGVYFEIDDQKGDGLDSALVLDRPPVDGGDITALFSAPADLSGSNSAIIAMDLGNRRTQNNTEAKSWRIIGLDETGQTSFELYVSGSNSAPNNERLHHVDSGGVLTPLGAASDFENTGSTERETAQSRLILSLTSTGYQVGIDRWPIDGIVDVVTGTLAYAGPATQVSRVLFRLSASTNSGISSGIIVDDVKVAGTAGNVAPTANDDGSPLANGGASILPSAFIGTGSVLGDVRVDDIDAGAGNVTATFQSMGAAPLTFSVTAVGLAAVGGDGTGTLTIDGTLADVNATLGNVLTYTTDAVTGGNASILFTINDNGNSGPGGAKSLTHNFDFFVNEGPTVTIDLAAGQDSATGLAPIEFEVVFSESVGGFTGSDVDLSASTAPGPLVATVIGAGDTYIVSVTGMSASGRVTISVPKGAANATAGGAVTEAGSSINDTVSYVENSPPTASNLVQNIQYAAGPVDIDDIVVSDVNNSVINTALAPQYDHPAVDPDAVTLVPDPGLDAGFAVEVAFTLSGFDNFGTVRVFEIGGSSNGFGIFLFDGIPHFVAKMNSTAAPIPSGLDDSDWADGSVSVPLSMTDLPLDELARIAIICDLDSLTYSVNGSGGAIQMLTNRGTRNDWSGGDTLDVGQNLIFGDDIGGLGVDPGGPFDEVSTFEMVGTVDVARLWHAPDASGFLIDAPGEPEEVTASLSFTPGEGDLTVPAGVSYDAGAGTWSLTGTVDLVNAALAAVQFIPNGTSPTVVTVAIEDGDEDGSGPAMGTLTFSTSAFDDTDGDRIPDSYEIANGLDLNDPSDAGSDHDGDGFSALFEYAMGTAAGDPTSKPIWEVDHVSATEVRITYGPITSGVTYNVNSTSDGVVFNQIDSFTAGADGALNVVVDATGGLDAELYQLEIPLPLP